MPSAVCPFRYAFREDQGCIAMGKLGTITSAQSPVAINEHRSALRSSSRFGFSRAPNALNFKLNFMRLLKVALFITSWRGRVVLHSSRRSSPSLLGLACCTRERAVIYRSRGRQPNPPPPPPVSAGFGLAAALCSLLRAGVLWRECALAFPVQCVCVCVRCDISLSPLSLSLSLSYSHTFQHSAIPTRCLIMLSNLKSTGVRRFAPTAHS
jgi:hypothetical protein